MQRIDDLSRWSAVRAAGIGKLLLEADAYLVDLRGAVEAREPVLAAQFAWHFVRAVLPVADMVNGGPVDVRSLAIERAGDDLTVRAFDLGAAPLEEGWEPERWLAQVEELFREVERMLGLARPLPSLRDPDGMFSGLARAREWLALCAELGVPLPAVAVQ